MPEIKRPSRGPAKPKPSTGPVPLIAVGEPPFRQTERRGPHGGELHHARTLSEAIGSALGRLFPR